MTQGPVPRDRLQAASPLKTPRAAAVAGIVFSVLLIAALVLLRVSTPADAGSAGAWLASPGRRTAVAVALGLVPFAGIAFLWFVGVVRDRIGASEDRFFGTVFLGSGLLFVGMLFVAAAVAGGIIAAANSRHGSHPGASTLSIDRNVTSLLLNVYAMRMAAVFTATLSAPLARASLASPMLLIPPPTVKGMSRLAATLLTRVTVWSTLRAPRSRRLARSSPSSHSMAR